MNSGLCELTPLLRADPIWIPLIQVLHSVVRAPVAWVWKFLIPQIKYVADSVVPDESVG